MPSSLRSPTEANGRRRLGSAALFALVLVAAESLAAASVGVREPGLYAGQALLVFAGGWAFFALPLARRVAALLALVGVGLFHGAFAAHDVDRRLGGLDFVLLAGQALVLLLASWRSLGPPGSGLAPGDGREEPGWSLAVPGRRILTLFAGAALVQALWCARFLFPSTDASAAWIALASSASVAAAPALTLVLLGKGLERPRAILGLALLLAFPFLAGRPVFWFVHQPFVGGRVTHQTPRHDVLLIVLDTVRADRMSLYGHARPTTPALERFAEHATVYEHAQSQAIWTLPGHASLFSGLYPSEHQAEWKDGVAWLRKLNDDVLTQAERFGRNGYRTACLSANAFLGSELGLAQGFEWLVTGRSPSVYLLAPAVVMGLASAWNGPVARQRIGPFERTSTLHATEINRLALEWLARTSGDAPRFLVLNYMDAHDPLRRWPCAAPRFGDGRSFVPDNLAETDEVWAGRATVAPEHARRLADWYDSSLACLDLHLGELFDALEARGLLDGMLVAVTSDHGHLLGEHDAFDHEAEVWRELTHVPLVLKRPGQTLGARCAEPAETASLAFVLPWLAGVPLGAMPPTEDERDPLELARFPAPTLPPGGTLCPLLSAPHPAISEAPLRHDLAQDNPRFATRWTALVDGRLKYFVDGQDRVQVADLDRPGPELLREPTPAELERARTLLAAWRAGLLAPQAGPEASVSDDEAAAAERLRLLEHQGYAGD